MRSHIIQLMAARIIARYLHDVHANSCSLVEQTRLVTHSDTQMVIQYPVAVFVRLSSLLPRPSKLYSFNRGVMAWGGGYSRLTLSPATGYCITMVYASESEQALCASMLELHDMRAAINFDWDQ